MTDEAPTSTGGAADAPKSPQHREAPPPAAPDADARDASPTAAADGAARAAGHASTADSASFRTQLGTQLSNMTDVINDNLVVVRYATLSSVLLLGIYGVANTPLFYRCINVLDIPSRSYLKRKWIHGRIVGVADREAGAGARPPRRASAGSTGRSMGREKGDAAPPSNPEPRPIVVLVRHSSPMERMLTQSAMDTLLSFAGKSPSRLLYSSANPHRNLLPIELAGVAAPPSDPASSILSHSLTGTAGSGFPTLDRLVERKAKVALQLLARRTAGEAHGKPLGRENGEKRMPTDDESEDAAICHVHYKKADQWISSTNVGLELVQEGQACINPNGAVVPTNTNDNPPGNANSVIADYDPTVKQLQADAQFMSKLEEAEYAAWTSKTGMWSSEHLRAMRREYAEEEESSKSAWRVWGWLKNGVGWVFRR